MIIDTHSHCYWSTLLPRIEEIISAMQRNNIEKAIQIGCDIETSKQAITLAKRFPDIFYATVGYHPEEAQDIEFDQAIIDRFDILIKENRKYIVGIGETGFDFHYIDGTDGGTKRADFENLSEKATSQIENQKKWWMAQWKLAQKYDLPLIIHTRDARDVTLEYMIQNHIDRCVMHCFSEDLYFAQKLLDFSDEIYFSFSGILTYKKSETIQEVARNISLHRILVETDAPFLSPQAVRGTVNEPANTRYTLEKLIQLRNESAWEIEKQVYENSLRFYKIKKGL